MLDTRSSGRQAMEAFVDLKEHAVPASWGTQRLIMVYSPKSFGKSWKKSWNMMENDDEPMDSELRYFQEKPYISY